MCGGGFSFTGPRQWLNNVFFPLDSDKLFHGLAEARETSRGIDGNASADLGCATAQQRSRLAARAELLYPVAGDVAGRKVADVYQQSHGATTVTQQADGTLDLICDDPRLGGLRFVPFRCGAPGRWLTIPDGSRVRVAFENGGRAAPIHQQVWLLAGTMREPARAAVLVVRKMRRFMVVVWVCVRGMIRRRQVRCHG